MKPYVFFGQNPVIGDMIDSVHALGGRLAKVVVNVPDPRHSPKTFAQRMADYGQWLQSHRPGLQCEVQELEQFEPQEGESYLIGFRGVMVPVLAGPLRERFGIRFDTLVHPSAVIGLGASLAEGCVVGAGAVVGAFSRIGPFAMLNRGAQVAGGAILDEFSTVGPGAIVGREARLREGVWLGPRSVVKDGVDVSSGCQTGCGAVLHDTPPEWSVVVGAPARVLKERNRPKGFPVADHPWASRD